MFEDFFLQLKAEKVPVSLHEYLLLLRALALGCAQNSLVQFYYLARSILIKSEAHYDNFDRVFASYFKDLQLPAHFEEKILDWLNREVKKRDFLPEELANLKKHDLEELKKLLAERLKEQKEQHHGGNKWIGTGGTSPFGHSGYNPAGIRIGGAGGMRSAVQIAAERHFIDYRGDVVLDTRQIKVALKKLRQWIKEGVPDELDIEGTIDKSCRNGGEIDLAFKHSRRNNIRVLLLMDVGGTMDPYVDNVEKLFSALYAMTHFKDFKHYYFHNCIYDHVYPTALLRQGIQTADLFRMYSKDYRLIVVGDAAMSPYELLSAGGIIDYYQHNATSGIEWLKRVKEHYLKSVWLNPESVKYWDWTETNAMIRNLFKMYPLSLDGISQAVKELR